MKRFTVLFILLCFCLPSFANNEVVFFYLNGSNTNTEKSRESFVEGAKKLHKEIYNNFSNDEFIKEKILRNNTLKISPFPKPFYWGDKSKNEIEAIEEDFDFLKAISPRPAYYVRKFIAMCLHDAIWISKLDNMYPIIQILHDEIMNESKKGNKVVLMGYSAGTFIVYEYLFFKMPIINLNEILPKNKEYQTKNTCADAMLRSKLVTYDLFSDFVFEDDPELLNEKLSKINDYTDAYCAPNDTFIGAVNFASPFSLFYSEMFDKDLKMSKVMAYSYKYIIENNMFWLTANYSDDPLGFPLNRDMTLDEIKASVKLNIEPNGGFIYDKSDKKSGRTFLVAHLAYFNTAKKYAKIVTKGLKEGYEHFYMTNGK